MNTSGPDAEQIFNAARQIESPPERSAYLDASCGSNAPLRARVDALLRADAKASDFLQGGHLDSKLTRDVAPITTAEHTGDIIGRYKLLQCIGEGGFGTVWMAQQREPVKRRVALKIIKLGMDTRQVIARFEAERQALAMMDHPNIAKVLDAGATVTGRPYFVMELVKGVPITDFCDTESLTTDERLELFISVCHAAQHAHQKGIIHRDIKPSNVLITLHDGKPVVKVIDFGIAKAINRELTDKTLFTEFQQLIGTPEYMSPEQAELSGLDIDTRSDIYSLGVLLYELLTGVTPFAKRLRSAALNEIQRIIREEEPPRPSTRLSDASQSPAADSERRDPAEADSEKCSIQYISKHRCTDPRSLTRKLRGDLDWIVMKALEKDRARRYETANGFASDIERHLNDEPVTATPPSTVYKLKKLIKRNKGAFAAAAAVFLVLTAGAVGTTWGLLSARAQADRAERELARATEVKRLIIEMFSSIRPQDAQGTDITLLKNILDDTAERLANGEIEDELIAADLHSVIGNVYNRLALYDEAERHLPVAVETFRRLVGEDDLRTLWTKTELAVLYGTRARYLEAERIFASNVERYERLLGKRHPLTLVSMNNLACNYRNQGKYDKAERMLLALREIQRRVPGSDPTLGGMELGNLYFALSRYTEAESAYLELIEHMRQNDLSEHPQTISAMQNLAGTYSHRRRYAEAAAIYNDVLKLAERVLGPKHTTTINATANLGYVRLRQMRLEDSEALLTEALRLYREVLGDKNPLTLTFVATLAGLREKQGRDADAEALYRQAIALQDEVLGKKHKDTLGTMTNFGLFLLGRGRYDEARVMFETTLPIKREVLGTDHHFTRIAMRGLADTYLALDRPADALALDRDLLEIKTARAEAVGADASTLNNAAWDLMTHPFEELHDPMRALPLAERACAFEEANGGENLWMYLDTLAKAQHLNGDTSTAVETQNRAISLMPEGADADPGLRERLAEYQAALATSTEGRGNPGTTD